jgi:hypothetical protein
MLVSFQNSPCGHQMAERCGVQAIRGLLLLLHTFYWVRPHFKCSLHDAHQLNFWLLGTVCQGFPGLPRLHRVAASGPARAGFGLTNLRSAGRPRRGHHSPAGKLAIRAVRGQPRLKLTQFSLFNGVSLARGDCVRKSTIVLFVTDGAM